MAEPEPPEGAEPEDPRPLSAEAARRQLATMTRDELTLGEMQRLGFWPKDQDKPELPAALIRRIGDLQREVAALRTERSRIADREKLIAAYRKQKMAESRQRRQENKEKRLRERAERAAAWAERKKREILYLGEGVSGGLGRREGDPARLEAAALPALHDAAALAAAMGLTIGELRFLAFHRAVSRVSHYRRFEIPKKTGGFRAISAPMPRLKAAQRWLLEQVLSRVEPEAPAHGFRPGRSILSNAGRHLGRALVVNFDLEDFFPTLTFGRVRGLFRQLGYSDEVATIFALLATEPDADEVELDGQRYFVQRGPRKLPQGAPSSPAITNLICRRLDRRLQGMAAKLGFVYSRYADDLTFSSPEPSPAALYQLLRRVRQIVEHEDFRINAAKTRVMRRGRRQEVTGLTVNHTLGVDRAELRRFRALLYQLGKDGPAGKAWKGIAGERGERFWAAVYGWASFVRQVDREKGGALVARVRELMVAAGAALPKRKVYPKRVQPLASPAQGRPESGPAVAPGADEGAKRWWEKLKFW